MGTIMPSNPHAISNMIRHAAFLHFYFILLKYFISSFSFFPFTVFFPSPPLVGDDDSGSLADNIKNFYPSNEKLFLI